MDTKNAFGEHYDRITREGGYFCPTRGKIICRGCFFSCLKYDRNCKARNCEGKYINQDEIFNKELTAGEK